jgi:hypothetical protein
VFAADLTYGLLRRSKGGTLRRIEFRRVARLAAFAVAPLIAFTDERLAACTR